MPRLVEKDNSPPASTVIGSHTTGPRLLRSGRSVGRASTSALTSRAGMASVAINGNSMQTRSRMRADSAGNDGNASTDADFIDSKDMNLNTMEAIETQTASESASGSATAHVMVLAGSDLESNNSSTVLLQSQTDDAELPSALHQSFPGTSQTQTSTLYSSGTSLVECAPNNRLASRARRAPKAQSQRSQKRTRLDCIYVGAATGAPRTRSTMNSQSTNSGLSSTRSRSRSRTNRKERNKLFDVKQTSEKHSERESNEVEAAIVTEQNERSTATMSSQESVASSSGAGPGPSSRAARAFLPLRSPSPTPFSAAPPPSSPAYTTPTPTPGPSQSQSQSQRQVHSQLPNSPTLPHKHQLPSDRVPLPTPEPEPLAAYQCPICFTPPTNATLTPCGHVCCGECLFTAVRAALQRSAVSWTTDAAVARCPVCRAPLKGWDGRGGGVIGLKPRTIISL